MAMTAMSALTCQSIKFTELSRLLAGTIGNKYRSFPARLNRLVRGISLAPRLVKFSLREREVQYTAQDDLNAIVVEDQALPAATCEKCGAKIYPHSFLQSHRERHQRRQRWYVKELRKLQYTMAHMRDLA